MAQSCPLRRPLFDADLGLSCSAQHRHVARDSTEGHAPTFVASEALESIADTIDEESLLDRRRTLDRLYELIGQLRPIDRQVMLLYLEELDAATIADITGLTAGNVATKIHRIKQVLARQFHRKVADYE